MAEVSMYSSDFCAYCQRAEQFLHRKGVTTIEKIAVEFDPRAREAMIARTGRRTVPQIYVGTVHVGGYHDLITLDRAGRLDKMLSG